eukprot:c25456_g1_i1 orf=489-2519(-)
MERCLSGWVPWVLKVLFWVHLIHHLHLAVGQQQQLSPDVTTLLQIKSSLGSSDNVILSTWSSNNSLCSWRNVQWTFKNGSLLDCSSRADNGASLLQDSDIAVYSIGLAAAGLNGTLPSQLSKLSYLRTLDCNGNRLVGTIPFDLGNTQSLAFLYLSHNMLNGSIPASLWNLCEQLVEVDLDHNELTGTIPSPAEPNAQCPMLQILYFQDNLLSGSIPSFLGTFSNLSQLNLSRNELSGSIPTELTQLNNLTSLDLSYNNLTGSIPTFKANITADAFVGNPSLCGHPLSQSCEGTSDSTRHKGLSRNVVAALVIGILSAAVVMMALIVAFGHKHNWGRRDAAVAASLRRELEEEDVGDGKLFRFEGGEHLTVEEVLNAPGEVLGKTSYGTVYKAKLNNGGMIALRLLREDTVKEREAFASVIHELGLIRHPNIVSILGYYAGPKGEKLLAYNYLSHGSLGDLLHTRNPLRPPLGWSRRHKIALGAARGLAHLHHGLHSCVIHGNLKSKNILVDENFEGHLADFGLDRLMNTGAQNEMLNVARSQGYTAPEMRKMSRANVKTDIYSFGIVLLEILTGKKPDDNDASEKGEHLPTLVKASVLEERTSDVFDFEIMSSSRSPLDEGLLQALQLAMGCCAPSPGTRPDIKEVIRQLEEIRPKIPTPLYTPTGLKSPRDFLS